MAVTQIWQRFGRCISREPRLSLAAFLGHAESAASLESLGLEFPTFADFAGDPAYDPDPHDLGLGNDFKKNEQLLLALMTWGREPVIRVAHACSILQCAHQVGGAAELIRLRDAAVSALQAYFDDPSDRTLRLVRDAGNSCYEAYGVHGEDPDSEPAIATWYCLGAPFMAATAVARDWSLQPYDGDAPAESQSSWIIRNAVWTGRAMDAARACSSYALVHDAVESTALAWATEG